MTIAITKTLTITKPLVFVFFLGLSVSAQIPLPKNEILLFSFKTVAGKTMLLSKNRSGSSVYYRFGTNKKTELQFHSDKDHEFKYSFYLRGGGASNEGMDLNYVYFTNDKFQYVIFDNYSAADNKKETGIKVIDLQTKRVTVIKADRVTIQGNLIQFRDNGLLYKGEDLFD